MKQWRMVAAWVMAAALGMTLTWQIVSLADDRVGESPGSPINVSGPSQTTSSTVVEAPTTTAASKPTSPTTSTPTTSSSSVPPSTSAGELMSVPTVGGTITVRVSPGSISYVSAVPAPGFVVEIDDPGPPDVRVELVSATTEVEVRVRWRDGQVEVRVDVD